MASEQLDKLWDEWMKALSESYPKTLKLLDEGKIEEASGEFEKGFVATIKKLYSEAASTYPKRFSKINDWCSWTRQLYILTRTAEIELDGLIPGDMPELGSDQEEKKPETVKKILSGIRKHFYVLHVETETLKSNDYIYAFRSELEKEEQKVSELKSILASLEKAALSAKVRMPPENPGKGVSYEHAKVEWCDAVTSILKDNMIAQSEIQTLHASTEKFYNEFGIQFE